MEVQNTQNKIYNNARRTYLDKSDLKEGEDFCRKCDGVGEILPKKEHFGVETCPKCRGRGIVDWVEQAVTRPVMFGVDSSSSSSISSGTVKKRTLPPKPTPPPSRIIYEGFSWPKWVTNYKRRKIV